MKKTRKTKLTSALLSAAVVLHNESALAITEADDMKTEMSAVVYGPPSVLYRYSRGDLNDDEKIDIVDYILMKAKYENPDKDINIGWADDVFKSDLDEDNRLTEKDLKIFERYLFGKIPSVRGPVYDDDYDDNPESVVTDPYTKEPVVTDISAAETTPVTTTTEAIQPVYGPFPITQPAYGTYPTSQTVTSESSMPDYETSSVVTATITTPVYGPYPAVTSGTTESAMPDYESYYEVTTTAATPVTQPVYGPYPTKTTVTTQSEVPDYETYPEVTTTNVSE